QEKVAEIEKDAYEKGYKDGQLQGIQEANSAIKNILIDCKSVLESIEKERKECLEDEEEKVYFTISNIAKQILKKDLELNPKLSLDFIKAAIDSLEHKLNISIYLEPNTASKINEVKSLILQDFPGLENLNIIGDSKLKAGDLIVESNREKLDLRLESQFEQLMKEICQKNK
ncbi:MAG: hypothetical protein LW817_04560, partial [Candidatus Caenarcaniphilales bacterium]|nr:hypothetical protein [Candidatus Caenarcaniphilales bacterium]